MPFDEKRIEIVLGTNKIKIVNSDCGGRRTSCVLYMCVLTKFYLF